MTNVTEVYTYLDKQGIKHSNLGYKYLTTAILLGLNEPSVCLKVTKLYERIADFHYVKASDVERTIRYSLVSNKITNKEFIIKAIDNLSLELNPLNNRNYIKINFIPKLYEQMDIYEA